MRLEEYIKYGGKNKAQKAEMFFNAKFQAGWLNDQAVPDASNILAHQKKIFKEQAQANMVFQNANTILKELQNDLTGISQGSDVNINIDESISKIEEYVSLLNETDLSELEKKAEKYYGYSGKVDALLVEMRNFFANIGKYQSMAEVQYALNVVNERLTYLEGIASSINSNFTPASGSLIKRITWTEYAIKGQYLEAAGKEFFDQALPTNIVINTGPIYGQFDIMSKFKDVKMKEDFMIFSNKSKLSISFRIGKDKTVQTMSIQDFAKYLSTRTSTTSIHLTEESYLAMQQELVTAVQAKATRSNRIKFGNVNILDSPAPHQPEKAIKLLKQIYNDGGADGKSELKKTHEDYDALFNYSLAHSINKIVGQNNGLLLTRNGIEDMYTFIMKAFEEGYYFKGVDFSLQGRGGTKVALQFQS